MIKVTAAVVAATLFAVPAFAQDAASTFTGGHVEIVGGFDRPGGDGENAKAFAYGIAGGFDFGSNNLVFGVEGEATDSTAKICDEDVCARAKRDLYVGGRVGTTVGPNTLLYVKGGYTNARFSASDGDDSFGRNFDGIRGGVGAEANVGRLLAKIEYRYSNYEDGLTRHQGVIGLGVRF